MTTRKFLPHAITLLVAALLVITQQVWASPVVARLTAPAAATSKTTVNYQGFLSDSSDTPVTAPVDMVFRLYNTETGGTALWTETQTGVPVSNGLFSVLLGSVAPLSQSLFDSNANLWLGMTIGSDQEMTPREKLASAPFALSGGVPAGVIVMWSGPLAAVPQGWALCDGANGTPDLRDRFILGTNAGENPGTTGGSHTVTLTVANLPSHDHPLTINPGGSHSHGTHIKNDDSFEDGNNKGGVDNESGNGISTTADGNHSHTGSVSPVGGGSGFSIDPKYYKLAFIMKL
jgi:microcystin-dependent protein